MGREKFLRAVIGTDGKSCMNTSPVSTGSGTLTARSMPEWGGQIDGPLTEIADLEGTGGRPQICDVVFWGCELSAVPLAADAPLELPYSHDGHDADVA